MTIAPDITKQPRDAGTATVAADRLLSWYREQARGFLEKHVPEKIAEFDRDCKRLA
jgi:hypothetical protein